jgi:hypothetical protein
MTVSKVHVTFTAGLIAVVSLICGTVALVQGQDAAPFFLPVATALGVIGGVAVPTSEN